MPKKEEISITIDERTGDVIIVTPYLKAFVDDLKTVVPLSARSKDDGRGWIEEEMHWVVAYEYKEQVQTLIELHFYKNKDHRISRLNMFKQRRGR